MIKQLQRRLILTISASSFFLIAIVLVSVNVLNGAIMDFRTSTFLKYVSDNNGVFSNEDKEYSVLDYMNPLTGPLVFSRTSYFYNFFYVEVSDSGKIDYIFTKSNTSVDDGLAVNYANDVVSSGESSGYLEKIYKFIVIPIEGGSRICFLNVEHEINYVGSIFTLSVIIAVFFFIIMFLVSVIVSKKLIRPFERNTIRQKQFIADAGHELKTPLSIISANTEVIEMTSGVNEWTRSIKKQTIRMTDLLNQMLALAKFDEKSIKNERKNFVSVPISDLVETTVNSFTVIAEKVNKEIKSAVTPMLLCNGDERALTELLTILIDNAIKYSPEHSMVEISLIKKNKSVVFETANLLADDTDIDPKRIFDRFYRADRSRSRKTGGNGIGLSIAKAITELHSGNITAQIIDNKMIFTVTLPVK